MEGIFFIWELITDNYFLLTLIIFFFYQKLKFFYRLDCFTWGESLNMGAQTIRGVEWCLAARARVCVPLTALRPPLASTVCVPMIT